MPVGTTPILLIACGNPLAGDDALGPLAARDLAAAPLHGVEVIDARMTPGMLLPHLEAAGRRTLIVVDAVWQEGLPPGRLIDVNWFTQGRPRLLAQHALSSHGWSIASEMELAGALNLLPAQVRLLGISIAPATPASAADLDMPGWVRAIRGRVAAYARSGI
jgi:hydrogenase maturation protease